MCMGFLSTLTCDQSIEQGYEILKKIKVDQDGNYLKSVQGFAIDVLWIPEKVGSHNLLLTDLLLPA